MSRKLLGAAAALGFAASLSLSAMATPSSDAVVNFGVYPHQSTGGIAVTQQVPPNTPYVYTYTIMSGDPISDTLPVQVCLDQNTNPTPVAWLDQVAIDTTSSDTTLSGAANEVTFSGSPWSFTASSTLSNGTHGVSDPGCLSGSITINVAGGQLTTVGTSVYQANIHFKTQNGSPTTGNPKLNDNFDTTKLLQIVVNVLAPDSRITCFMTDSDGNLLRKCDGTVANNSGEEDGTFAIVANAKNKAVSTNPGQFYYNLLWVNDTGSDQTVNVGFTLNGLVPQGTQALHWLNFPTTGFGGVNPADFDDVIEGNPAGATGPISNIVVPAGDTLYVTYHLEWNGLGMPAPDCGACGDATNTQVTVTATVSGTFSGGSDTCEAGALGYNKQ